MVPPFSAPAFEVCKSYLEDAALPASIFLSGPPRVGKTTVLRHLYVYYYGETPQIAYWRDAVTQTEVHIIVRSPAYGLPFEVKNKENPRSDKRSRFGAYCSSEDPKQVYPLTKRDADFTVNPLKGTDTKFLKICAYILCHLLGQSERSLWK
ncbi:MAG: hypothetical protein JSW39_11025 [Desulfobacterales bacterium]|nr:MAG: hypothetical protein JSW39_11025 [Desulfobacterales bacterium]